MTKKQFLLLTLLLLCLPGCRQPEPEAALTTASTIAQTEPRPETQPTRETAQEELSMEIPSILLSEPLDSDFVRIRDYIPDIREELIYATDHNFTGSVIYTFSESYLRYGTAKKLMAVQEELKALGLGLKIWDGFRPVSAQFRLWEIYPDSTYVANPNVGFSNHSRGNAVDVTLVTAGGAELEMPTQFDDFSGKADRNYQEIPELPRANAELLEDVMERHGFRGYEGEWWHFNDTERYDPETVFDPGVISLWTVTTACDLLEQTSSDAAVRMPVPEGSVVTVMGYTGDYALAVFRGSKGYLPCSQLFPCPVG